MADPELERLDPIEGRAGGVTVRLTGMTCRRTAAGRRYPYSDFGLDLIDALHDGLAQPTRGGLFRARLACPSCDTALDEPATRQVDVATDVALATIPPIRVELTMPGLVCPRCRRSVSRIDSRVVASDVSDALIAAFDSAAIHPG